MSKNSVDDVILDESSVSIGYRSKDLVINKKTPRVHIKVDMGDWEFSELSNALRDSLWIDVDRRCKSVEIGFNEDVAAIKIAKTAIEAFFDVAWVFNVDENGISMRSLASSRPTATFDDEIVLRADWDGHSIKNAETRDRVVAMLQALEFGTDGRPLEKEPE